MTRGDQDNSRFSSNNFAVLAEINRIYVDFPDHGNIGFWNLEAYQYCEK